MARSTKAKEEIPSSIATRDVPTGDALVRQDAAPDAFMIASQEIDTLYQRIKDGDASAVVELRSLSTALRLKMALVNFKQALAAKG
jgi:hypothetical protein